MEQGAVELLDQIYKYASLFLAAVTASWLTYFTAGRQKKIDILSTERLTAFKVVQTALVNLKHYCEAAAGELSGGDLCSTREILPTEIARSALSQAEALRGVIDRNLIFLPKAARADLDALVKHVSLLASMELATTTEPELAHEEPYLRTIEQVEGCVERLYAGLKLPS